MIYIYTDGSCDVNKKVGGWAFIAVFCPCGECISPCNKVSHLYCHGRQVFDTTNNRMELTAVIEAINEAINSFPNDKIIIFTDSQYVIGCGTEGNHRSKNLDLWEEFDKLYNNNNVQLLKVMGHSGNKYNEMVDKLCVSYRKGKEG